MKTREWLLLFVCAIMLPFAAISQCGTVHNLTYDTTVTGGGSAYPGYNFNLKMFNPSLGTLTSVKLTSVVTLSFAYTIENLANSAKSTKVRIERTDTIIGPSADTLASDYYSVAQTSVLAASDGVTGTGPDFKSYPAFYILNGDTVLNQTTTNVVGYMGAGSVGFVYKSDVGSQINGNPNININGAASDVIKFAVTYTYCDNILLASDITSFSASKKEDYINLLWVTSNELPNHSYELQKSYDGKNFVAIATVPSHDGVNGNAAYSYNYVPLSNEKGKIYFRIKQVVSNVPKYTPVRLVDLGDTDVNKADLKLVPNPSNGVFSIMVTNNTVASDWSIELFNIKGQVISKKLAANTTLAKFAMNENLSAGVYFVMVTNRKNNQKFVERMIVN